VRARGAAGPIQIYPVARQRPARVEIHGQAAVGRGVRLEHDFIHGDVSTRQVNHRMVLFEVPEPARGEHSSTDVHGGAAVAADGEFPVDLCRSAADVHCRSDAGPREEVASGSVRIGADLETPAADG